MDSSEPFEPPTLDVAWVWHIHKLDPLNYARICKRWFGRILDVPCGMSPFTFSQNSLEKWSIMMLTSHQTIDSLALDEPGLKESLVGRAGRQASLLWHMSTPQYDDIEFVEESVRRYELMLTLMEKHPNQFIVATYDIDNIWHTHLAYPRYYLADCLSIAGREIGHDDSDTDRSKEGKLNTCAAKTAELWTAAFGSSWRKAGAMYRGEPPELYWKDRCAVAGQHPLVAGAECAVSVVGCAFGTISEASLDQRLSFFCFVF
jgi:hypothetical protein